MKGGELVKELKKAKLGNFKQLLRRLKLSVPLTKLLQLSQEIREYLLYCLIYTHAAYVSQLVLLHCICSRDVTTKDYANYGTLSTRAIPKQLLGAYTPQTQHPALGKKSRKVERRQENEPMIFEALRGGTLTKVPIF